MFRNYCMAVMMGITLPVCLAQSQTTGRSEADRSIRAAVTAKDTGDLNNWTVGWIDWNLALDLADGAAQHTVLPRSIMTILYQGQENHDSRPTP